MARWGLTLHIYLSMAGFLLVLLFAVTGLTLNHEDFGWSQPRITHSTITLPLDLVQHPDERAIGDWLRATLRMPTPVSELMVSSTAVMSMIQRQSGPLSSPLCRSSSVPSAPRVSASTSARPSRREMVTCVCRPGAVIVTSI